MSAEEYIETLNNISPKLKQIRLKEAKKETGKFLSKQWFSEYWRGERSLSNVFYVWIILLPIAIKIILLTLLYLTFQLIAPNSFLVALKVLNNLDMTGANSLSRAGMLAVACFGIVVTAYYIVLAIIMWRCSSNYTNVKNWGVKILAVLVVIGLFA